MNKHNLMRRVASVATELDVKGFTKEAKYLDSILLKLANDFEEGYSSKNKEDFIREFQDVVDWNHISRKLKLSEDFIREFQDKVNWIDIFDYQDLSEDFKREFMDRARNKRYGPPLNRF